MNIARWSFDDSGYYAYLLVDCSEEDLSSLKSLLKEQNFSVLASGRSFRPALDGRQYGFYVRLGTPINGRHEKPSKESVVTALQFSQALSVPVPPQPLADTSDVLSEIFELKSQVDTISRSLQEIVDCTNRLVTQNNKQGKELQNGLINISSRFREEGTQIISSIVSALDTEQGVKDRLVPLEKNFLKNFEEAESEWIKYNDDLKDEVATLKEEVKLLRETNIYLKNEKLQPKDTRGSHLALFKACLPSVNLLRGCEDILFFELADTTKAIGLISQLVLEPNIIKAEKVEGTKEWSELRFSRDGRLYFRRVEDKKLEILVSKKQEQKEDIKYLQKYT